MKYEVETLPINPKAFKPFKVTLTFETHEEYVHFHDKVMGRITKVDRHNFHADVYYVGKGEKSYSEGEI